MDHNHNLARLASMPSDQTVDRYHWNMLGRYQE